MGTVGKLADVAQTQNVHAAAAALRGLGRIAGFDNSTWTYVTPATLGGVALAYRNLREKDLIPKTETLEIGLGGRQGPAR
jgi:hypothetical protein